MVRGLFITLEGTEGAGKSTQLENIRNYLEKKNRTVVQVREPGGTPIAEDIRKILKTPRIDDLLCDNAELLLMYAARAQLVERYIIPNLKKGIDVICDRHDLSTVAYQGGGRGISEDDINALRKIVLRDFRPDLTILLDIDPVEGMKRAKKRGELDRFEQAEADFFERVRNAYLDCARADPERIRVVDAGRSFDEVNQQVIEILDGLKI